MFIPLDLSREGGKAIRLAVSKESKANVERGELWVFTVKGKWGYAMRKEGKRQLTISNGQGTIGDGQWAMLPQFEQAYELRVLKGKEIH